MGGRDSSIGCSVVSVGGAVITAAATAAAATAISIGALSHRK